MQNKISKLMLCIILNSSIISNAVSITITSPANGSTISNKQPVITGTVFPNIGVDLKIDGITSPEGNRQTPNKWKIKSSTVLSNGTHKAVATVTTQGGQTAKATSTFTIGQAPSNALTIDSPKNGSTSSNNKPKINGTTLAPLGSLVNVKLDGVSIANVRVKICPNTFGINCWEFKINKPLSNGTHTIVVTTNIAGTISKDTSTFTIKSNKLKIIAPKNGTTVKTPLLITGNAQPGSRLAIQVVNVKSGRTTIGSVTVNQSGYWSFLPAQQILGQNVVRVTARSTTGAISHASSTFNLVVASNGSSPVCCK